MFNFSSSSYDYTPIGSSFESKACKLDTKYKKRTIWSQYINQCNVYTYFMQILSFHVVLLHTENIDQESTPNMAFLNWSKVILPLLKNVHTHNQCTDTPSLRKKMQREAMFYVGKRFTKTPRLGFSTNASRKSEVSIKSPHFKMLAFVTFMISTFKCLRNRCYSGHIKSTDQPTVY